MTDKDEGKGELGERREKKKKRHSLDSLFIMKGSERVHMHGTGHISRETGAWRKASREGGGW